MKPIDQSDLIGDDKSAKEAMDAIAMAMNRLIGLGYRFYVKRHCPQCDNIEFGAMARDGAGQGKCIAFSMANEWWFKFNETRQIIN